MLSFDRLGVYCEHIDHWMIHTFDEAPGVVTVGGPVSDFDLGTIFEVDVKGNVCFYGPGEPICNDLPDFHQESKARPIPVAVMEAAFRIWRASLVTTDQSLSAATL